MDGGDAGGWGMDAATRYAREVLTGEVVRLRGLREEDFAALVAWRSAPEVEILQSDAVDPAAQSRTVERLRSYASGSDSADRRGFAVEALERDGRPARLLGLVTLGGITLQHRSAELAIALDPGSGGHGYGVDAVRVTVRYGFRELGLHRIRLSAWSFNERAIRTYRRAGFIEEGRLRDAVFHDGRWHDGVLMSALATDPAWT